MHESERWNVYSHLIGVVLSVIGLLPLTYYSFLTGDVYKIIGISVYGVCLVLLFLCSTIYHSSTGNKREFMQKMDHCSIFLLIAGTYTPFMLITLRETSGIYILAAIWLISALGILFKFYFAHRFEFVSTLFYLFCGWLIIFDFQNFYNLFQGPGFYWLAAGGLAYSIGAVFFLWERIPKNHEIWHVFVLAGGFSHYISIFYLV
ncbi:MAG: hemolysin III family protein [Leptospiraceae bacterium]|nr:hemolysin III family protein [Leptospiraceae bacterium]